jgi:hypothetical protein
MRKRLPQSAVSSFTFALIISAIATGTAHLRAADPVTLEGLLNRAAWYLDYFVDRFENVVAEEQYAQNAASPLPTYSPFTGRGGVAQPPSAAESTRARHRDLRSDFLLVKSPETEALVPFRDVIAVDGVVVRDREARLARLFLNPAADAMAQAEQIRDEGARYNLGNMRSTIGNPVMALAVLQRSYQPRFHFSLGKEDRGMGANVWIVEYKGGNGAGDDSWRGRHESLRSWPSVDRCHQRPRRQDGARVEQPSIRAVVTTTFRPDDRFDIGVPLEMRESYAFANGNNINTVATYGRFRRFDVRAEEEIHSPRPTYVDAQTGMTFVELIPGRFTMAARREKSAATRTRRCTTWSSAVHFYWRNTSDAAGMAFGDGHVAEPLR